ncbi:NmrA family NAD(P)-binding protein [Schumannella sp. 10F1B-5-1]|uniref:NmrA family NAD(P)-binding protein n=1 Tax=Schumannella sp. 10F1B-5-1 TaxID=2590780 RepID=UPI001130030B|nr:NmrA family NAD(P)-binding protein [Schumannella sp. 10F1B-5-1]TPW78351.1 NAD-dependent epimerase/dehydratase family protein [Schumannella sp. 10F1B-5-1]
MTDILLTGASGSTGGAIAQALTERGETYRALSRRDRLALPAGGTHVRADLDDKAALAAALDGVRAAFLVTPSTEQAESQQRSFIDTAVAAGAEHIVLLSQFAAAAESPVRFLRYHAAVEEHLSASGIGATILRPNLFMQGLLMFADQLREGILAAPIGDASVSAVDVRDIGAVGAAALTGPPRGVLELTGPAALTHAEMAHELAAASDIPIRFADAPPAEFAAALRGLIPDWQVEGLVEDYAHYAAGEASRVGSGVRDVLGRDPLDFSRFAVEVAAPVLSESPDSHGE